jgi:hypothetical protein
LNGQTRLNLHATGIMRAGEQSMLVLRDPTSSLIDSNENRLESGPVQRLEDIAGRQDRNLVLGGLATKHDSYSDLPTLRHPPLSILSYSV